MNKENTFHTIYSARYRESQRSSKKYPESQVVLDPTCTLQMILNRAEYGVPIPQRDETGTFTQEELSVLGIDATTLHLYNKMQLLDLRMKAQTRMAALRAAQHKREASAVREKLKAELRHELTSEQ